MDGFAKLLTQKAMNYAQKNPDKLQAYGEKALKFASRPNVQQKAFSMGQKGFNFLQSNPQVQSRLIEGLNLGGMTAKGSLEQRVSRLEQQMAGIMGMMQGGKTRKQKKTQRKIKTRKH